MENNQVASHTPIVSILETMRLHEHTNNEWNSKSNNIQITENRLFLFMITIECGIGKKLIPGTDKPF
jgi:hypothetical protein